MLMQDIVQDIVAFVVTGIGFVIGFAFVSSIGEKVVQKAKGGANRAAAVDTGPAQRVDGVEPHPSKTRMRLTDVLAIIMIIAAYRYFPPHAGFLGGAGAGAIVAIAMLVAPAIVKACSEGLALIRSD
jgi:hypothetical protein